jgi:D-glycero-alpha-D-manno-heptose 1-phosphate guanylyltransferase
MNATMVKEAIILAGGAGTRLRSAVPDLPKCMAPVNGVPFLHYVIHHLEKQGIETIVLSLGYRSEAIVEYIAHHSFSTSIHYVIEATPLGTGGGIKLALGQSNTEPVLVLNGDTLFQFDLPALSAFHFEKKADCTLALKPLTRFDRYGLVETNAEGRIIAFKEKQPVEAGTINAGVYLLQKASFLQYNWPPTFSFEKDYLEKYYHQQYMAGLAQDVYFIDIGIPADYEKAQTELKYIS